MESEVEYTASPPPYTPPASDPYYMNYWRSSRSVSSSSFQKHGKRSRIYCNPPPYTPPASDPYYTTGGAADPYPAPAPAPGPTSYPPPGFQQYPPPPQYPEQPPEYSSTTGRPPAVYSPEQVVVVSARHQQHPVVQQVPSFVGHKAFACLVLWICNCMFGLFAVILVG